MDNPLAIADLALKAVQAILLFAVAFYGARIAHQQMTTARIKLQLDLFDRRFRVYSTMLEFGASTVTEKRLGNVHTTKLYMGVSEATFLFGDEIRSYIRQYCKKASELQVADIHIEVEAAEHLRQWFQSQAGHLRELFGPYLEIRSTSPKLPGR